MSGASVDPVPPGAEGLRAWMERADGLRSQHALADAAHEYRAILASFPGDRGACRGLIATELQQGDTAAASRLIEQLLHDTPTDLETWRDRAALYRALGNPTELLRSLQSIEKLAPTDRSVLLEEYQLNDVAGESEEAYRCLAGALQDDAGAIDEADRPHLLLRKGELSEKLGRLEDAEAAYTEASTAADGATAREAAKRSVRIALQRGRPDLALTALAQVLPSGEGSEAPAELLLLRAETLLKAERPEEAQGIFDRLLASDPTEASALVGAARSRIEQGKHPEARAILTEGLKRVPRNEALVLALAEAESGCGDLPNAERAVREGLEILPKSRVLWTRLAEIALAHSDPDAALEAYRHAIESDPNAVEPLLGAAFASEQRGKNAEALSFYDRAATLTPKDARIWTRRGLALAALHRGEEARESFDRALAIDPESDAAREGKKLAEREHRQRETDVRALAALRLEGRLGRPVTKNDLFVQLKVPFDQLDAVLAALSREVKIDIPTLDAAEFAELEARSCSLITAALAARPPGLENRGLALADVASLAPPSETLAQVQRLFAYVDTALRMEIRPENLRLSPESEEVARRALSLPIDQRTLFGLVRTLKIGIFQARVVKAVERASDSMRPPLPSVDLSPHSPEFAAANAPQDGTQYFSPENVPAGEFGGGLEVTAGGSRGARRTRGLPLGVPMLETQRAQARESRISRCLACGGIASITHGCGATLCQTCIRQFSRCPKCGFPFSGPLIQPHPTARPARPALHVAAAHAVRSAARTVISPREAGITSSKSKPLDRAPAHSAERPPSRGSEPKAPAPPPHRAGGGEAKRLSDSTKGAAQKPGAPATESPKKAEVPIPVTPPPRVRRDKPDDEPRL